MVLFKFFNLFRISKEERFHRSSFIFRKAGFSAIEMAVTLGIVTVLTGMAVANFSRFKRKQRQVIARSELGTLFAQMTTFESAWRSYYGHWVDINYVPAGEMIYNVGFASPGATPGAPFVAVGMGNLIRSSLACGMAPFSCTTVMGIPALMNGETWLPMSFTAGAIGDIGGAMDDHWTINQLKVLTNVQDGTW